VVLYELLLHRKPFPADTVTTLIYQILHQDPFADAEALQSVGADISAFLRSCLAKQPADRVQDAVAFAARARELAARAPAAARSETTAKLTPRIPVAPVTGTPPPPPARRWPIWPWIVGLAALLFIAVLWLIATRQPPPPPSLGGAPATPASEARIAGEPSGSFGAPSATGAAPASGPSGPVTPAASAADLGTVHPQEVKPPVVVPAAPVPTPPAPAPVEPAPPAAEPVAPAPAPAYTPPVAVSDTFRCRKAAEFNVSPEEAHVLIDGRDNGIADDWDGAGGGKDWSLASGEYVACFAAPKYKTACVRLVVSPQGEDDVCDVDTELDRDRHAK
jgi:hypothetical protein